MSLVSKAEVKTFQGISDSSKDAQIELMIAFVEKYLSTFCGRIFEQTTNTEEKYDGKGSYEIVLNNYPVISFTKLEKNNSCDNSDNWEEVDSNDYWVDNDTGIITKTSKFNYGKQNYRATYISGYAVGQIPDDLRYAVMVLISDAMSISSGSGIKSESLGDHSITFRETIETNSVVKQILNSYRKIPLC